MQKTFTGFTLVELLTALIIVGILTIAALASYQKTILKMRRAEARSALYTAMMQQERFYTQHNTYGAFNSDTKDSWFKKWSGDSAASSYYQLSATPCHGKQLNQCVLLTASSSRIIGKYVDDPICGDLMLDSANNKSYSKGIKPNAICW